MKNQKKFFAFKKFLPRILTPLIYWRSKYNVIRGNPTLEALRRLMVRGKNWLTLESLSYSLLILVLGVFLLPKLAFLTSITEESIIELTNEERQAHGLQALTANQLLAKAAYDKGRAIFLSQEFKHNIDNKKFSSWIKNAGYNYSYAGENLAIDFYTSEGAVKAWMESPTHRQNILNDRFSEIGIAVVENEFNGRNSTLIVQIFGSPLPLISPAKENSDIEGISEVNPGINIMPMNKYSFESLPLGQDILPAANIENSYFGIAQINNRFFHDLLPIIGARAASYVVVMASGKNLLQINYIIITVLCFLLIALAWQIRRRSLRTNRLNLSQ